MGSCGRILWVRHFISSAQKSLLSKRASNFSGPKLCDWPEQSTKTPGTAAQLTYKKLYNTQAVYAR